MDILILSMNKYLCLKLEAKFILWWKLECYSPYKIIGECEPLRTKDTKYKKTPLLASLSLFNALYRDFKFCYRYWFTLLFMHVLCIHSARDSHTELLWHSHAVSKDTACPGSMESLLWNDCSTGISEARFPAEKGCLLSTESVQEP